MIRKVCGSQSGFSIIQGMVLAGIVAGMAYMGTKLTTDQKMAQKGVESKSRVEQLHSMIYSIMQNKNHCTETFLDNAVVPAPNTSAALPKILTKGAPQPVFVNRSWYHATRDTLYMNNSVAINSMSVDFKSDFTQHADLRIEYGKLEDTNTRARSGKGFGGKQIAKVIKLKIQTNPADGTFESCYAVDEGITGNQNMVKEFCEGLGTTNTVNLFEWSDTYQKCILKDLQCPTGKVFAGYDSNGLRRCFLIKDWMNVGSLIDTSSVSACNAAASSAVSFVIVGGKVKVQCL
jgi:hypothetical protein